MKPEEKRFEEYMKSMTPEQKQECLELIRKNNQGILAKDFILSEMPAYLDTKFVLQFQTTFIWYLSLQYNYALHTMI